MLLNLSARTESECRHEEIYNCLWFTINILWVSENGDMLLQPTVDFKQHPLSRVKPVGWQKAVCDGLMFCVLQMSRTVSTFAGCSFKEHGCDQLEAGHKCALPLNHGGPVRWIMVHAVSVDAFQHWSTIGSFLLQTPAKGYQARFRAWFTFSSRPLYTTLAV